VECPLASANSLKTNRNRICAGRPATQATPTATGPPRDALPTAAAAPQASVRNPRAMAKSTAPAVLLPRTKTALTAPLTAAIRTRPPAAIPAIAPTLPVSAATGLILRRNATPVVTPDARLTAMAVAPMVVAIAAIRNRSRGPIGRRSALTPRLLTPNHMEAIPLLAAIPLLPGPIRRLVIIPAVEAGVLMAVVVQAMAVEAAAATAADHAVRTEFSQGQNPFKSPLLTWVLFFERKPCLGFQFAFATPSPFSGYIPQQLVLNRVIPIWKPALFPMSAPHHQGVSVKRSPSPEPRERHGSAQ